MKFIKKIIGAIALIILVILFGINLIYISNVSNGWQEKVTTSYFGVGNIILVLLIVVGIIRLSSICEKINVNISKKRRFIGFVILIIIYLIIQFLWINYRDSLPIADSMRVYRAACRITNNTGIQEKKYFELNPHNLLLSYLFSFIFRFIGSTNLIILKLVNCIANVFTIIGLYFILNILKKEYKANKSLFMILSFSYIPIILLTNFIYGDLVSLPFVVFSIFFAMKYIKDEKKRYILYSMVLIMLAIILRKNNLIFMIAISMYLAICLFEKSKRNVKQLIIKILLILLFIAFSIIPSKILKNHLERQYDLNFSREFPITRYIAMGCQEGMRANGWYNDTGDIGYKEAENNNKQYSDMIRERIKVFSNDVMYTVKFYSKKIASMWTDPLQESIWQNLSFNFLSINEGEEISEQKQEYYQNADNDILGNQPTMQLYMKAYLCIVFGSIIIFIIKRKNNISNEALLLIISFIGGFFFHIIWEGKSRYIIPYIIILIPIASIECNVINIYKLKKDGNKNEEN